MKRTILIMVLSVFLSALTAQDLQIQKGKAYLDGKLFTGTDVTYFEGTEQIKSEALYTNGLKNGVEVLYHTNGEKKAERIWAEGLKDGVWVNWDENGNKTAEASYKMNKKHGDWFIYSADGVTLFEMHYVDGQKVGTWNQHNENGELVMQKTF